MKTTSLLIFLLPFALFAAEHNSNPTVEQLFSVKTIKVQEEKSFHTKKNYGYIKVDDARVYDIAPRFSGYVEKLYLNKTYSYVKKGDKLASIYSPEVYKAQEDYLNSYNYTKNRNNKGMLRSAKLKLELLGIDKREIDKIIKTKKVSPSITLYAPVSGYLFVKNITNGSAFVAKEKIFEIVNLDEVWLEAKIFEQDIPWIKQAQDFQVTTASTKEVFTATSTLLYPNVDPKEATLTLRLSLKNKKHLLFPGMYATLISQDRSKNYLTLPQSAVILKDGKHYAFVVGEYEGEYEPVEVQVQPLNNETYIVQEGLSAGDEVVDNALFMMDSDAQINGLY